MVSSQWESRLEGTDVWKASVILKISWFRLVRPMVCSSSWRLLGRHGLEARSFTY